MAIKMFRKGEVIFEEGDTLDKFFIVQSGSVQLGLRKDKRFVDFFQVGPNGFLGEYGLLGHTTHMFTAVARSETQVMEIPKQGLKEEINQVPGFVKILIKSTLERLKLSNQTLRHVRSPDQLSLFPAETIPLLFAAMFYTVKEKAIETKVPGYASPPRMQWVMDFKVLRNQMQRTFGLSVAHVTHFCHLLWRLKILEVEEPIRNLKDWNPVEQIKVNYLDSMRFFFDFYQYYYYKTGREEVLKLDTTLMAILEEIHALKTEKNEVVLSELEQRVLKKSRIPLISEHFSRFEKKGIFIQRVQRDKDALVEGDWKELSNVLWSWRFLHFFDTANEHGTVEFELAEIQAALENECPTCKGETQVSQKFCPHCGAALAAKAA